MWEHMVENCKKREINDITLVTSSQAKEFYTKMGVIQIGEVDFLVIKGRKIPKLVYTIEE